MVKVNNKATRIMYTEQCSEVFIVNFEHISHLILAFLLLALSM